MKSQIFRTILISLISLILSVPIVYTQPQTQQSLDDSIKRQEQEKERLIQERKRVIRLIRKSKKSEWGVMETLKLLQENIRTKKKIEKKIKKDIDFYQELIKSNVGRLKKLKKLIRRDRASIEQQIKALFYLKKVREMTRFPGASSFKHYFRNRKILQKGVVVDIQTVEQLRRNMALRNLEQSELEKKFRNLKELEEKEKVQQELLEFEERQQATYLHHLERDKDLRRKYLQEIQVNLETIDDTIYSLKQEKIKKKAEKKFNGFRKLKEALPSPVSGSMVHSFGKKSGSLFYNQYKKGVLVDTGENEDVHNVLAGKVAYSGPFRGFRNLVIIDHGKGSFSVYGNLDDIYVKENDIVNQGANLGTVAYDTRQKKYLFYFETRYKRRAVNPMKWLKKPAWNRSEVLEF